jgi:predicted nucleic acid-binding protein
MTIFEKEMKALVDTSVWVPGMIAQHEFHERALPWIKKAEDPGCELCVSSHTLAE